jgi:hypothetical protein
VLWKILDGKSASEPEYCTALKDRTKDNGFIDIDIKTTEIFGRWFADITEAYDQIMPSPPKRPNKKTGHFLGSWFVADIAPKNSF